LAQEASNSKRMSVYALRSDVVPELKNAIGEKYSDDPTQVRAVAIDSVDALLVSRMMSKKSETDWSPVIRGLTGEDEFTAKNEVAAAVLIVPSGEAAFAICYGMGHLLLEQGMIEPAFGLRFAIRSADPEQVRGITRRPLEQRAQINRQTVPGGQALQAFGIEEYGEVISRLAAKAGADLVLTANSGKPKRISFTAGNSLALPLARTPRELLGDLNRINEVLSRPAPEPFDRLEQLQPLGPRDPRRKELNAELCKLLSSGAREHLNLAFPWEREEEYGEEEGFLVYASGKKGVVEELSLDYILELVHQLEPDRIQAALSSFGFQAVADAEGKEAPGRRIPLAKWLAADLVFGDKRYFFQQGQWYEVGAGYVDYLNAEISAIFDDSIAIDLPEWAAGVDEGTYNQAVADQLKWVCLDKKLARTPVHPRGIELADLLNDENQLLRVKEAKSSAPLSHLFAQSFVSFESLLNEPAARTYLTKLVKEGRPDQPLPKAWRPAEVVLAMGRERAIAPDDLFTFSKVNLVRLKNRLQQSGVHLSVKWIPRSSESTAEV
jgi:uncharacterized protein (TIGR04141 family)